MKKSDAKNWAFPIGFYFKWKLEFISNILWMVVSFGDQIPMSQDIIRLFGFISKIWLEQGLSFANWSKYSRFMVLTFLHQIGPKWFNRFQTTRWWHIMTFDQVNWILLKIHHKITTRKLQQGLGLMA